MDEWEWPAHCNELRQIESHLRCLICGDFFHGPVLLRCSHVFCSECVRKFLQTKGASSGCCPECKQSCAPCDLVPNRPMEKVVLLFQQMKPNMLPVLQQQAQTKSSTASRGGRGNSQPVAEVFLSDGDQAQSTIGSRVRSIQNGKKASTPLERLPLLSYSVMKDKEIRKLLETIGIRLAIKNRDEIIQIHKEYVLLSNAQADSCNPKSAAQLREEVTRNYRLRQQDKQKQQSDAAKQNANGASPSSNISAQMKENFERLKQEIAARKMNKQPPKDPPVPPPPTNDSSTDDVEGANGLTIGIWRHIYAMDTKQEFYINSVTHEIRLEPPSIEVQQQNPANRYDGLEIPAEDINRAVESTKPEEKNEHVVQRPHELDNRYTTEAGSLATPSKTRATGKRPAVALFFSPDTQSATQECSISDGDDEEISTTQPTKSEPVVIDVDANSSACAAEEAKWECPRCTLINEVNCTQCEACGYDKQPSQQSSQIRSRQTMKKRKFQSKISL